VRKPGKEIVPPARSCHPCAGRGEKDILSLVRDGAGKKKENGGIRQGTGPGREGGKKKRKTATRKKWAVLCRFARTGVEERRDGRDYCLAYRLGGRESRCHRAAACIGGKKEKLLGWYSLYPSFGQEEKGARLFLPFHWSRKEGKEKREPVEGRSFTCSRRWREAPGRRRRRGRKRRRERAALTSIQSSREHRGTRGGKTPYRPAPVRVEQIHGKGGEKGKRQARPQR